MVTRHIQKEREGGGGKWTGRSREGDKRNEVTEN